MSEIEDVLVKIRDKGCAPMILAASDLKGRTRRLMGAFPETSSWDLNTTRELFKKMEEDFKKEVVSDVI